MELFKKRLKRVGGELLFGLIVIVIAGLIGWGLVSLPMIVLKVIAGIIWGLLALGFIFAAVSKVCKFIKWLFIEPFKKK